MPSVYIEYVLLLLLRPHRCIILPSYEHMLEMCVLILCGIAGLTLQTAEMPLCVSFCVRDDENCMVWCLALVCGRMWEETLARAPSIHVTSHCRALRLGLHFYIEYLCIRLHVFRPRTLQGLIIASVPCCRTLVKDPGQRIQSGRSHSYWTDWLWKK